MGLSDNIFSLRTVREQDARSPFEVKLGRQHVNFADHLKSSSPSISEDDPNFKLELYVFPHDPDSTIFVRESACGSKLKPAFRRQRGRTLSESQHTLSLLPAEKANSRLLSKRDVACTSKD